MADTPACPTVRAEVGLYGFVYDLAAPTRLSVDLPGRPSVRDLLETVARTCGDAMRRRLLNATGGLQPGVQVFVAGDRLRSLDDRLPEAPSLPVKILVLQGAAGG